MIKDPLYKIDSKGKVRVYQIEIDGDKYRMITGLKDGAKVSSKWTVCTPKHVGKANATTAEEQAVLEADARYRKKLKEHYHATEEEAVEVPHKYFKPQLAEEWEKVKGIETWPEKHGYLIVDPKLDGQRLIATAERPHSRTGRDAPSAAWIFAELENFFKKHPDIVLDGELYNHDYSDNFNDLMSIARREKLNEEQAKTCEEVLEFHIYDMFDKDNPKMDAAARKAWLVDTFKRDLKNVDKVHMVPFYPVYDYASFVTIRDQFIKDGYEGAVVRIPTSVYKHGRSKDMIKVKEFITEEFPIIRVEEGKGNRSGIAGRVIVDYNGVQVGCGIRGNWKYSKALLEGADELVGEDATVRHFGETPDGSLRFPVCIDVKRWNYE